MQSQEIRKLFFDYFTKQGHTKVASSSLIPAQDPTLLFANAGMNQFKDVFLGKEQRSYTRAVSIQKCIRAGGKHNDLDQVGFTARHLTFFEMMGNFSFGDYFKKEAIQYAWEFLTKYIQLPADKLYASVYEHDHEAYDLWKTVVGLPESKIVRLGAADNFWQMGDMGPCGPCTEIYFDRGTAIGCQKPNCAPGCSCDRFLEIWNLVFMQYDRQPDGTDVPLKKTGVDTGMGLERLCAVVQNKDSVFDTDIFAPLIAEIESATGISYHTSNTQIKAAFRVIVDHVRSASCAIADGCTPAADGRGYVLRKIIRRAALFAQKLGTLDLFPRVATKFIEEFKVWYPELDEQRALILSILTNEIEKFAHNLVHGKSLLEAYLKEAPAQTVSGAQAFKLYDTYGFPLELTQLIAQEHGFSVDGAGFEKEMEKQRAQSGKKEMAATSELESAVVTEFTGYRELKTSSPIVALLTDKQVNVVPAGTRCWIIAEKSPFYVECGGQVNDQGTVTIHGQSTELLGLKKMHNAIAIEITAPTNIQVGDTVEQQVHEAVRLDTMKNHTATHLLQAALIAVFGKQVKQAGSLVAPDYLRFDFTYHEQPTVEQITEVEKIVNESILKNVPLIVTQTSYNEAIARGVIAFFGEKYNPDAVRVVEVPGISAELCGGTHVRATGDIGCFKITELTSLSAGNRRIVAVTGRKALETFQNTFNIVKTLGTEYKVKFEHILEAVKKQSEAFKESQLQVKQLKKQLMLSELPQLIAQTKQINGVPYLYTVRPQASAENLKELAQLLMQKLPGFYFVVTHMHDKTLYYGTIAPEYAAKVDLKKLGAYLKELGLSGGASSTLVQGGGKTVSDLEQKITQWVLAQ